MVMKRKFQFMLIVALLFASTAGIAQAVEEPKDVTKKLEELVDAAKDLIDAADELEEEEETEEEESDEPSEPVEIAPVPTPGERAAELLNAEGKVYVYRVPITEAISKPNLYILRRSIKQAIENDVNVIVLDMDTPGGRLDITLDMMELLDRFNGETITFVNDDAVSAGAYISMATNSIYFSPAGVMGAAAVVSGAGGEIEDSMKAKINSYLFARMETYTDEYPYRTQLIRAMADIDYELKIDGKMIKPKGELLSLTAKRAVALYGNPAKPLLADGIAESIEDLLSDRYGEGVYEIQTFEISWSEEMAKYLDSIAPLLLGIGILLLFAEFKTPGFGIFGIAGLALVAVVFISNYMAGLAGYEAIIFFILGLILIIVDVFLLPGTIVFMLIGIMMVVGSLIWTLSDVWPVPDGDGPGIVPFTIAADSLWNALYQVLGTFAIALLGLIVIWRFLPKTPLYGRLVHSSVSASPDLVVSGGTQVRGNEKLPDQGSTGVVTNPLHPLGEVEIDGVRYQAKVAVGAVDKGLKVVVVGYKDFCLLVEQIKD
jgi:membrane-bound serine protease (ClpP class)